MVQLNFSTRVFISFFTKLKMSFIDITCHPNYT